ncbi:hypothetical protein AXA44_36570 [Rhodococcus sp. SC4]|nr:hypothetical protein AXA44_36570 [Rhodococcus sp. SC4]
MSFLDVAITEGDLSATVESRHDTTLQSTRVVGIADSGRPLATAVASFESPPRGRHRPHLYGVGDAPDPHTICRDADVIVPNGGAGMLLPLDVRPINGFGASASVDVDTKAARTWMRFEDELPDDLLVHAAALSLSTESVMSHQLRTVNERNTAEGNPLVSGWQTLNYSLWFHRCFRADDWVLVTQQSSSVFGNRAFFSVTVHSSQGRHIASAAQEFHLIR